MKKFTFILFCMLVGCTSLVEKAANAKVSGQTDFVSFKILEIDRTDGYLISGRWYYPTNKSIDIVNVQIEIKNTSTSLVEVSLQPSVPLQGQEVHRIVRVFWGGNYFETLQHITDRRYETEAIYVKNETLDPGFSMFRVFSFSYPKDKLPNQLIFRVRKDGDPSFEEIPVKIESSN